jgi:diguanylate cyclase (GGDEF)-like protein/PAS domain S-box-containing protein
LVTLLTLVVCFSLLVVQAQGAATAYVAAQGVWSQAQQTSIHKLLSYSVNGQPQALAESRQWQSILQADRRARSILEAKTLDYPAARKAFMAGQNHPSDIPGMIWLFRCCSQLGHFNQAIELWRMTDPHIERLATLTDALEQQRQRSPLDDEAIGELRAEVMALNAQLKGQNGLFRQSIMQASRWMAGALSLASLLFLLLIAAIAWWLCWHLVRVLQFSQDNFRALFAQAEVGMIQLDQNNNILTVNPAICTILNDSPDRLEGQPCASIIYPDDWELDAEQSQHMRRGQINSYTIEQRLLKGHGGTVWARLTYSRVSDNRVSSRYIVIVEDVSESRRLSVELSYQATHDHLTGTHNRRAFERRLSMVLAQARAERQQHALFFVDLDQFKVINDTSGHHAGDRLLLKVVSVLQQNLREHDMLARLGGDEFGVIIENCSLEAAEDIAEKLRRAIEKLSFTWNERQYDISASIGVVPIAANTPDAEHVLRTVDIACYLAKEQGRNRIYVATADDQQQLARQGDLEWLNRIRSAIDNDRLYLDAQLIVPINPAHNSLRYEVLVRLIDDQEKTVSPGVFLPAAERFGAAHSIDRWVIEHTFSLLAAHPEHLAKLESCHINLSGVSLDQPDLYTFISDMLQRFNIPGHKICFEITETAAVNNLPEAVKLMQQLGEQGCRFGLDDFGTGLSSFAYLRQLPIDDLKIDGMFVRDIDRDETDLAMVRAINEVGQTLHKKIIAEFVENQATLTLLTEMGVDFAQGFGLHKPCKFTLLLATPNPLTLVGRPPA